MVGQTGVNMVFPNCKILLLTDPAFFNEIHNVLYITIRMFYY